MHLRAIFIGGKRNAKCLSVHTMANLVENAAEGHKIFHNFFIVRAFDTITKNNKKSFFLFKETNRNSNNGSVIGFLILARSSSSSFVLLSFDALELRE